MTIEQLRAALNNRDYERQRKTAQLCRATEVSEHWLCHYHKKLNADCTPEKCYESHEQYTARKLAREHDCFNCVDNQSYCEYHTFGGECDCPEDADCIF